jgi:hypothetical protein
VLLPIWHKIDKQDIQNYSLYLSDIKALSTELPMEELCREIINIVRPDIINSHLLKHLAGEARKTSVIKEVPLKDLAVIPGTRHAALPVYLVVACRLIEEVFHDVIKMSYKDMLLDFAKDWEYDREFIIWSAMANAYITFIRETHCDFHNIDKKREAFNLLLSYSIGFIDIEKENRVLLTLNEHVYLIQSYINNLKHISGMVDEWNHP